LGFWKSALEVTQLAKQKLLVGLQTDRGLTVEHWLGHCKAEGQIASTTMLNSSRKPQPDKRVTTNSGQDEEGGEEVTC